LCSGYDCIDNAFDGGIYPGFIIVAGDSNLGKSAFVTNLVWNLVDKNPDVYVMDISLDDAMPDKLSRMAACSGQLIINAVKTPRRYMNYPMMLIRRKNALIKLRNMSDRYMAYDSASIKTDVESIQQEIENKIEYFKTNNINKRLVVCIDSFHDMTIGKAPSLSDKEKYDRLAQWCADIAIKFDITVLCTGELKKLNGMRRPQMDDLRESVKIKYEAKAILLVYNEVHYKGEAADVYYTLNNNPHKQPVFEVHFAKNKFGTYKGRNFFHFYPDMSTMKECDPATQKTYSSIVYG
jgi:replicative DNA helicase